MLTKLLICAALCAPALGWWCTGHMLVAQIAQNDLTTAAPEALEWAQTLVTDLPSELTHGISNTFVESACWPDDIKSYGLEAMNDWHFVDQPYNPDGMMNIIEFSNGNALWALDQFSYTLTSSNRAQAPLETSMAMRYLIHLTGDIHQPLHVTEMWNEQFPNGDEGGNLFLITFDSQIQELHALWDSCMGHYVDDPVRPLNTTAQELIEDEAQALMQLYPRASLSQQLSDPNTSDWATANYHLAVTYAYNITFGSTPSQNYLEVGWSVIEKQLALAGYRLSNTIQQLYTKNLALYS